MILETMAEVQILIHFLTFTCTIIVVFLNAIHSEALENFNIEEAAFGMNSPYSSYPYMEAGGIV